MKIFNKIRKDLELGWTSETAYPGSDGSGDGLPNGQCYVSSMYAKSKLATLNPIVVSGRVDGYIGRHFWLEIDGKILDFTADQFNEKYPKVLYCEYSDFTEYKRKTIFTGKGNKRVKLLKKRIMNANSHVKEDDNNG